LTHHLENVEDLLAAQQYDTGGIVVEDFTAELLAFPGRHDDQVDALTQGLAWGRVRRGEFSVHFVRGMY
jgi:hypothetical protein